MGDDRLRRRTALEAEVHAASDDLQRLTGQTDQSPQQVAALHPDHPATGAWQKARDALVEFEGNKS